LSGNDRNRGENDMAQMMTGKREYWSAALVAILLSLPVAATAQEACATYTVQPGDSLSSIAEAAYGSFDYQMIFNANRDALAANPNTLPAGLQLILPCDDGRLSADSALSTVIATEDAKQADADIPINLLQPPVRFVSGNGWKPFTDESLAGGGILVRIATTALQRGGNNRGGSVEWVDDWGAHTDVLLPSGAFDVSIAWSVPDCTKLDLLGDEGKRRCTDFIASLPVYEVADTVSTLNDSKYVNASTYEELAGARICKPEGWSMFPLEQAGLVEPFVTYVRPATPKDCAEALIAGEADVFSIELESATEAFRALGVTDQVSINPTLVSFLTFHFISARNNPRARVYIAMLNEGLTEMRQSGEWYDIVATGLAE
jgi:ABC-type amino acid transport substrate-binding protein